MVVLLEDLIGVLVIDRKVVREEAEKRAGSEGSGWTFQSCLPSYPD
jgi:hypothetical protein